jgi:putative hydrolase of the HAD superfamily
MKPIKAIGFDLFNTLITAEPRSLEEATTQLVRSLQLSGFPLDGQTFKQAHKEAAARFIKESTRDGKETHNRYWISAALETFGFSVPPDDPRIARGVDAYFSAFIQGCQLIPETREILKILRGQYRLGLLSNFTHPPAAMRIIDRMGLNPLFQVVLISGDLGFRKPHPSVFDSLMGQLRVKKEEILYVGDDPESDVQGALQMGIEPIWMTYVWDRNVPHVPGYLYPKDKMPDKEISRISDLRDLPSLLEKR